MSTANYETETNWRLFLGGRLGPTILQFCGRLHPQFFARNLQRHLVSATLRRWLRALVVHNHNLWCNWNLLFFWGVTVSSYSLSCMFLTIVHPSLLIWSWKNLIVLIYAHIINCTVIILLTYINNHQIQVGSLGHTRLRPSFPSPPAARMLRPMWLRLQQKVHPLEWHLDNSENRWIKNPKLNNSILQTIPKQT